MEKLIEFYSNIENIKETQNIKSFLKFNNLDNFIDEPLHINSIIKKIYEKRTIVYRFNEWFIFLSTGTNDIYKVKVEFVKNYINKFIFREDDLI